MIIILSQENDKSTDDVIDWIYHKKIPFLRINSGDLYFKQYLSINSEGENFITLPFDLDSVKIVWLRRFHNIEYYCENIYDKKEIRAILDVKKHLRYESNAISDYFLSLLKNKKWLTSIHQAYADKLQILHCAMDLQLTIPATLVTSDINDLLAFQKKHKMVISKPLSETEVFIYNNKIYSSYTSLVTNEILHKLKKIPLTLFQELIPKEFEIRVFYFLGKCYSMAIFSQADEQTTIDFRVYNFQKPNRVVPYTIDKFLEGKIHKLMKKLDLETGSLDFIKSSDGRTVFLEVNPVGQFGMVSYPCNYYLENEIANYLIKFNTI